MFSDISGIDEIKVQPAIERVGGHGHFDIAREESRSNKASVSGVIPIKVDRSSEDKVFQLESDVSQTKSPRKHPASTGAFAGYQLDQRTSRNLPTREKSIGPDPRSTSAIQDIEESRKPSSTCSAGHSVVHAPLNESTHSVATSPLHDDQRLWQSNWHAQEQRNLKNIPVSIGITSDTKQDSKLLESPRFSAELRTMNDEELDKDVDSNQIEEPIPGDLETNAASLSAAVDRIMLSNSSVKIRPTPLKKTTLDRINETAPLRTKSPTASEHSTGSKTGKSVPITIYAPKSETVAADPFRNLSMQPSQTRPEASAKFNRSLSIILPDGAIKSPLTSPMRSPLTSPTVYTGTERGSIYSISQKALAEKQYIVESQPSIASKLQDVPEVAPPLEPSPFAQVPHSTYKAATKPRPASMMNTTVSTLWRAYPVFTS